MAVTNREAFWAGCRSMPGAPYDGHTLAETLERAEILSGVAAKRCHVDCGYKVVGVRGVRTCRSGQRRGVNTRTLKRELKRRSAIEVVIGRMKTDGRVDRCRLKEKIGDAPNAVLVAAGHNIWLLPRAVALFSAKSWWRCGGNALRRTAVGTLPSVSRALHKRVIQKRRKSESRTERFGAACKWQGGILE